MVNNNQIKIYIDDSLKKGYSLKQIEQSLISAGHDPSKVKEALSQYKKKQLTIEEPIYKQPVVEKKNVLNKKLIFLIGGCTMISIVVLFFVFFNKPLPIVTVTFDEDLQRCVEKTLRQSPNNCLAYTKDDITLCDECEKKEECESNYQLFKALANQSCETISDPTSQARILCECLLSKNVAKCKEAFEYDIEAPETPEEKNILYTSITNHDSSNCNKISKKESQKMCYTTIHTTKGLINSDIRECEKIPDLEDGIEKQIKRQKFCKALVTKDPLLCVREEIFSECRKSIIIDLSKEDFFSTQVCEVIEDEEGKDLCFDLIQESQ